MPAKCNPGKKGDALGRGLNSLPGNVKISGGGKKGARNQEGLLTMRKKSIPEEGRGDSRASRVSDFSSKRGPN